MSEEETTWLNTKLSTDEEAEFQVIKRHLRIRNRSDVVRYLIHKEAASIAGAVPLFAMDVHNSEASQ